MSHLDIGRLGQAELRRGNFLDAEDLINAIEEYIEKHNQDLKPFIWSAKVVDIPEKVNRAGAG